MKKAMFILSCAIAWICADFSVASAGPAMDRVIEKQELVVGMTGSQPPLNATAKDGKIIGLDADIARAISSNMGVGLRISKMPFGDLLTALESGKLDMVISSMTMTLERNLKVAFVGPYYVSGKGILTKAENIADFQQSDGLNRPGYRVAALEGSTSLAFAEKEAPQATMVATRSYDDAIDMLLKGKIDALIADFPFCAYSAFRHKDKGLVAGQAKLTHEPLGIAVREDPLWINWLQNFMMMMQGSGQLEVLTDRWFKDGAWIKELP